MNLHQIYEKLVKADKDEKGIRIDQEGVKQLKELLDTQGYKNAERYDFGEPYSITPEGENRWILSSRHEQIGYLTGEKLYIDRLVDSINAMKNIVNPTAYKGTIDKLVKFFLSSDKNDPETLLQVTEAFIRSIRGTREDLEWIENFEKEEKQ